ncbi:MAG TPA: hypothetical protein VD839_16255 [Burkholderiales bacterium]|jgi:hypothetical protein|nr:hypothetical protein [Burkholderiales bacterium]
MMMVRDFPTYEEIQAFERAARRAQAEEMYRLATLAAGSLKSLAAKFAAVLSGALHQTPSLATTGGPGDSNSPATLLSILEDLADSLPENLRARHEAELMTAMRVAPVIDLGIAAWEFTVRVLAGTIRGIAQVLRAGARGLDVAARRLMPLS